jgi:hypothetical protein
MEQLQEKLATFPSSNRARAPPHRGKKPTGQAKINGFLPKKNASNKATSHQHNKLFQNNELSTIDQDTWLEVDEDTANLTNISNTESAPKKTQLPHLPHTTPI